MCSFLSHHLEFDTCIKFSISNLVKPTMCKILSRCRILIRETVKEDFNPMFVGCDLFCYVSGLWHIPEGFGCLVVCCGFFFGVD